MYFLYFLQTRGWAQGGKLLLTLWTRARSVNVTLASTLASKLAATCFALRWYLRLDVLWWYANALLHKLHKTVFLSTLPSDCFLNVNVPSTGPRSNAVLTQVRVQPCTLGGDVMIWPAVHGLCSTGKSKASGGRSLQNKSTPRCKNKCD